MMKIQEIVGCLQIANEILLDLLCGIYQTEGMTDDIWKERGDERYRLLHEISDHLIEVSILIEWLKQEQQAHQISATLKVIDGGRIN